MCWEIDYKLFADQKKAQEFRIEQERRAGVIDQLLNEANTQGETSNVERSVGQRDRACEIARLRSAPKHTG